MNERARFPRIFALLISATLSAGAGAQEPVPAATPRAEAATEGGVDAPTRDLIDWVRDLRHKPAPPPQGPDDHTKRMLAFAPVLTYGPTSGFGLGVAGNLAVYRGSPLTTRISSLVASATATTKKQVLVSAKLNAHSLENRWHFEGDNRLQWTSQKTYGLGTATRESGAVDQKFDFFRFYETQFREVAQDLYLGAGFHYSSHRDVRPVDDEAEAAWDQSPYVEYSQEHGFDLATQSSAGLGVYVLLDSRDGSINPSRGWYTSVGFRAFFDDFLGGSSSWQQVVYDARAYLRLSRDARHRLAFWTTGDLVTGGAPPYLDLPATGMDTYGRAGRGYPQGRFRGERLLYGEVEYRWTVSRNGLFGLVSFLNTQTLTDARSGEELFDSFATGAGVGLRLMLNKRSQTNLCLDIGWGREGSRAVYFAVQEAF